MAVKGDRNIHLESAKDFHNHIVNKVRGVQSFYVEKSEVLSVEPVLQKYWQNVLAIPNIQSSHHFRIYDSKDLLVARTSTSLMTKIPVLREIENNDDAESELPTSKTRLYYQDVFTDTDSTSEEDEVIQTENKLSTSGFKNPGDVHSGMFVLIEVPCEEVKGRKSKNGKMCRYAATSQ